MRTTVMAMFLCFFGVVVWSDEPGDKAKLQGKWKVTLAKTGKEESDLRFTGVGMTITGNKVEVFKRSGEPEGVFTFTLDPEKTPKEIDLHPTKGEKKVVLPGIYKLDANQLQLCWSSRLRRPPDFQSVGGQDEWRSFTLERVKK